MTRRKVLEKSQLGNLLYADFERIIDQSNLGKRDTAIAKLWLLEGMKLADIGAAVGYDRSTVGKKLPWILDRVSRTAEIFQKK